MEALESELDNVVKSASLSKSIEHIQTCIDELSTARNKIAAGDTLPDRRGFISIMIVLVELLTIIIPDPKSATINFAQLQNGMQKSFDNVYKDLRTVNTGLNKYSKALDKVRFIVCLFAIR